MINCAPRTPHLRRPDFNFYDMTPFWFLFHFGSQGIFLMLADLSPN